LAVADVPRIRRVRFTTSHPRDFSRDIVEAIESEPKLCNHVHLPVQSGSSRVLSVMQRTYSRREYLERIAMLRGAKRPISITTDIIVGFPGETTEEFEQTLTLMNEVRYEGVYSFKYSPRPNTVSLAMGDTVSEDEKSRRLGVLQQRQREIQAEHNAALVGSTFEVMVSSKSRREHHWSGHTTCNRVVSFTAPQTDLLGNYLPVRITGVSTSSLNGERVS
jgi:tRNA-2-methylthio-N6-dimethylallyladenosine synthase